MCMFPKYLVVDLFCGAGGVTTGFELSGVAKVVACVNHDHVAILSHWANHPGVKHFEEDITTLELGPLVECVRVAQRQYPDALLILWASLECTNFSKAKGGLARDADSRTLADHLHRYITALNPDYIMIENVVEFLDWGPSQVKVRDGKNVVIKNKHGELVDGHEPIPEHKGKDFVRWCEAVDAHGYRNEWRQLNSADFGAYTSRNRLFGCFAKDGLPIIWPEATHHKAGKNGLKRWNAVREKLDFKDTGYSIFNRGSNMSIPPRQRKDLSENTMERVYAGCIKHIAGGKDAFMTKYHGGAPRTNDLDKPLTVIDTENRHAFVTIYHGNGDNTHSIAGPMPVIAAADVNAVCFLDKQYSGCYNHQSVDSPAGTIMNNNKLALVQASFSNNYLMSLQYGGQVSSVDRPAPVLLASSDKTPLYLMTADSHAHPKDAPEFCDAVESEIVKKLREFMCIYNISDIRMRMLRVDELLRIQGFPDSYNLLGTQSDQKKFIGNSVVPHVVEAWAKAMSKSLVYG